MMCKNSQPTNKLKNTHKIAFREDGVETGFI